MVSSFFLKLCNVCNYILRITVSPILNIIIVNFFYLYVYLSLNCSPTILWSFSSIYSSFYLTIHPSIYLFIHLSTYSFIYIPIHPSIYLFIHLSTYSSIYLPIRPSIYLFIHLSTYSSIYLLIHPSVYLFIHLSINLYSTFSYIIIYIYDYIYYNCALFRYLCKT